MSYDEIVKVIETLGYRDKLRLAQLLIQIARKEEEEQKPADRKAINAQDAELVEYVKERLIKLKPAKNVSLLNSISAMFQFQGGISESDVDKIVTELIRKKIIFIDQNHRVSYLG